MLHLDWSLVLYLVLGSLQRRHLLLLRLLFANNLLHFVDFLVLYLHELGHQYLLILIDCSYDIIILPDLILDTIDVFYLLLDSSLLRRVSRFYLAPR